jgi:DNA polymerase-3 subunit gamma/tau
MYICEREDISVESQALKLIAKGVSGSLRDAENLLQQLVIYYGNQINVHQAEEILGITADFRVRELAEHIVNKNIAAGLVTISSLLSDGLDLSQFNRGLVEYLRSMLLAKSGAGKTLDLAVEDSDQVRELADSVPMDDILKALKLFGQLDLRSGDYSPLPLELALVESILSDTEEKEVLLVKENASVSARRGESPVIKNSVYSAEPVTPTIPKDSANSDESIAPSHEAEPLAEEAPITEEVELPREPEVDFIRDQWADFVETLRGMGSSGNLDAFLRSACEPVAVEDDTLVLAFYYSLHKEKIEDPKYRHLIEKKLGEKFSSPSKVRCVLRPKAKQRAVEGHLVRAALEMGGRITSVEEK